MGLMNTVLFTSSTSGYNDKIVSGLIHFTLTELLKGTTPTYAAYHPDEQVIELSFPDERKLMLEPHDPQKNSRPGSARYDCVRQMIYELDPGDTLFTHSLSDLGDTAAEAEKNYFALLSHGIILYFYDMYFLNSDTLKLNADPTADQKNMICNIIRSYYDQNCKSPTLSPEERKKMNEMPGSKKK